MVLLLPRLSLHLHHPRPRRDLLPGEIIWPEDLEIVPWPAHPGLPDGTLRDASGPVGRIPQERILAGEPIREARLAPPEAGLGLPAVLSEGQRAWTTPYIPGLLPHLTPSDHVDLIDAGLPHPTTILAGARVLQLDPGSDTITLAVPEHVLGALEAAEARGALAASVVGAASTGPHGPAPEQRLDSETYALPDAVWGLGSREQAP